MQRRRDGETHDEYRQRIQAELHRLKHPNLALRFRRVVRTMFSPRSWSWPPCLISFLWRITFSKWIFVKSSLYDLRDEAAALRYVRAHTSVPVPTVYFTFAFLSTHYLFMSRISGEALNFHEYNRSWTEAERTAACETLRGWVKQLRSLGPSPFGPRRICSARGGPVYDHRICTEGPYGPYADEDEMKLQIRQCSLEDAYAYLQGKADHPEWLELFQLGDSKEHELRFTHGDIAPRNIIVHDRRLVALIDWGSAGWFPEHWEYLKMHFGGPGVDICPAWYDDLPRILEERYNDEVVADKFFGVWGLPRLKWVHEKL